jgi:hypothetical protein
MGTKALEGKIGFLKISIGDFYQSKNKKIKKKICSFAFSVIFDFPF